MYLQNMECRLKRCVAIIAILAAMAAVDFEDVCQGLVMSCLHAQPWGGGGEGGCG